MDEQFIDRVVGVLLEMRLDEGNPANKRRRRAAEVAAAASRSGEVKAGKKVMPHDDRSSARGRTHTVDGRGENQPKHPLRGEDLAKETGGEEGLLVHRARADARRVGKGPFSKHASTVRFKPRKPKGK